MELVQVESQRLWRTLVLSQLFPMLVSKSAGSSPLLLSTGYNNLPGAGKEIEVSFFE